MLIKARNGCSGKSAPAWQCKIEIDTQGEFWIKCEDHFEMVQKWPKIGSFDVTMVLLF